MEGWIKLHRGILEWGWIDKPEMVSLFIHLLCMANTEDHEWHGKLIKRGQIVTGRKELSRKTGISERTIRTCIERLKTTNEITIKTTNKYSIVTICNYDKYQIAENENDQQNDQETGQQPTNNRPTTDQQLTTLKEYKNIRNNIKKEIDKEKKEPEVYVSRLGYEQEPDSDYRRFMDWIKTECPNAAQVQRQLTDAEFYKLLYTYGLESMKAAIESLDNWRDFPKKRTSLYRSTLDELKRESTKPGTANNNKQTAPRDDRGRNYEEF